MPAAQAGEQPWAVNHTNMAKAASCIMLRLCVVDPGRLLQTMLIPVKAYGYHLLI